ncbi:MAG: hypothetical protein WHV61_11615 [Burkholderiales bacterium]
MSPAKKLLTLVEFMGHARLPNLYRELGFEVTTEFQARKAVSLVRRLRPDVIVADFYFQADFRDRLSNLESLLATAQPLPDTKILVLYEPASQAALDKVRARLRIDEALTIPVQEDALRSVLSGWR